MLSGKSISIEKQLLFDHCIDSEKKKSDWISDGFELNSTEKKKQHKLFSSTLPIKKYVYTPDSLKLKQKQ